MWHDQRSVIHNKINKIKLWSCCSLYTVYTVGVLYSLLFWGPCTCMSLRVYDVHVNCTLCSTINRQYTYMYIHIVHVLYTIAYAIVYSVYFTCIGVFQDVVKEMTNIATREMVEQSSRHRSHIGIVNKNRLVGMQMKIISMQLRNFRSFHALFNRNY